MSQAVKIEGQPDQLYYSADSKIRLFSKEEVKKDQDSIRRSLIKLDLAIHENAVQCLIQAETHGDTSLMRRLLIDIVDAKSGYRRQGLIVWMRKYSPMELKGDVIKLTGVDKNGERKPFLIELASGNAFTGLAEADEKVGKPVYRDVLMSRMNAAIKAFREAVSNTTVLDGKNAAIDKSKPFYDGIHMDKMAETFDKIENNVVELSSWKDSTKDVREAQDTLRKAQLELASA